MILPSKFKIAFLGSSSFVVPILADIHKRKLALGEVWLCQLQLIQELQINSSKNKNSQKLTLENSKNKVKKPNSDTNLENNCKAKNNLGNPEKTDSEKSESNLEILEILPIWWQESELLEVADFLRNVLNWLKIDEKTGSENVNKNSQTILQNPKIDSSDKKNQSLTKSLTKLEPNLNSENLTKQTLETETKFNKKNQNLEIRQKTQKNFGKISGEIYPIYQNLKKVENEQKQLLGKIVKLEKQLLEANKSEKQARTREEIGKMENESNNPAQNPENYKVETDKFLGNVKINSLAEELQILESQTWGNWQVKTNKLTISNCQNLYQLKKETVKKTEFRLEKNWQNSLENKIELEIDNSIKNKKKIEFKIEMRIKEEVETKKSSQNKTKPEIQKVEMVKMELNLQIKNGRELSNCEENYQKVGLDIDFEQNKKQDLSEMCEIESQEWEPKSTKLESKLQSQNWESQTGEIELKKNNKLETKNMEIKSQTEKFEKVDENVSKVCECRDFGKSKESPLENSLENPKIDNEKIKIELLDKIKVFNSQKIANESQIKTLKNQLKSFETPIINFWESLEKIINNNSQSNSQDHKFQILKKPIAAFLWVFWLHLPVDLSLVVSQPDKVNRGKTISNPVSSWARDNQINLETPTKLNLEVENLSKYNLSAGVVASFGQILNSKILQTPLFGFVNWHPSKLPKYRGCTPIQSAIMHGESETALSWIKMTPKMDAGFIWLQISTLIKNEDNFETISDKMGKLGAKNWTLPLVSQIWDDVWALDL